MSNIIHADALTTFEISPDGNKVRLNVRDEQGSPGTLELPAGCMNQLLMSLPGMIQQALRRNQGDHSLRLAYPMEGFRLEQGDVGDDGAQRYLLTLQTDGSFEITFAIRDNLLGVVAQTIVDQVIDAGQGVLEPVTLNS